jgi:dolichol-phosphate mannosyltransferase
MTLNKETITVVVPVYLGANTIEALATRCINVIEKLDCNYELIFVNDASPDNSWQVIKKIANNKERIIGINFSRNFGQHYAISAGLDNANGDWVVVLDCDLQDIPEEIEKLYKKAQEGYNIVLAQRQKRKDNVIKIVLSKIFYGFLGYLSGASYDSSIANFGIYQKQVIDVIISLPEKNRFFPSMVKWVGFSQTAIPVKHAKREDGESSYNFKRLLDLSIDIILSYSDKPLRIAIKLGASITIVTFLFSLYQLYKWLNNEIEVLGYTSLIISIWFFSGIIILLVGVVGLYIGKIFENVKDRPTYIIKERI